MYGRIKPNSWEQRKLDNLLINQSIDICSEPSELGRYEVIQQGDIPVVGYTNENPFEKYEDIVLFGDHTLSLYKPNSPFLIATDGVKTFYSKGVIGLFLYYLLLKNLPKNEGYKRYSTILKDKEISLTYNQDEQKHIAGLLLGIDNLITLHQRKFFNWLLKFELNLIELFYSWEQRKLSSLIVDGGSGGTPLTSNQNYYNGTIPFLSITDISNSEGYIFDTEKHISKEGLRNSAAWIVPAESISLAMYASVGKVAILKENTATSQAFYNLVFDNFTTRNIIFQILKKKEINNEWISLISTGTQANLNAEKVREAIISIPLSKEEQDKISGLLFKVDSLITLHQRE